MNKQKIATAEAPAAIGPYSQGIAEGALVFVSGQIPLDAVGKLAGPGIVEQTGQCLKNLAAVLKAAGLGMENVVKTTVFMTNLGEFASFNEEYAKHFTAPYPARATVEVRALPKGVSIEIEAVAVR